MYCGLDIYQDMPRGWESEHPSHRKIKNMWRKMWDRCTNKDNKSYKWYSNCTIEESWRYLSNYYVWFKSLPNYQDFLVNPDLMWCIDKDLIVTNNKHYGPYTCSLITQSVNAKESLNRNGLANPRKSVMAISQKDNIILLFTFMNDVVKHKFNPSSVSKCCRCIQSKHKGYKWYYVNYNHNRNYRVREGEILVKNSQ